MATSQRPLTGLSIIESTSFVAGPSAGMALAELGADVIRVDPPGGASDQQRWPVAPNGASLFWANLNKGKRSAVIDYRRPEGRELLLALIASSGEDGGIFVDNVVGKHQLRYDEITNTRADAIHLHILGRSDGSPAVDYTVNTEIGVPQMTGPIDSSGPVNHVVPTWDLLAGMTAATSVLAAVHHRAVTGDGAYVSLALADIALAGVASMGWLAEAHLAQHGRERHGNHIYGSYGSDFTTSDHHRVMVVALTEGQWHALHQATGTSALFETLEEHLPANFDRESDRYQHRNAITAILQPWFAARNFAAVSKVLNEKRVLWGLYEEMSAATKRAISDPKSVVQEINQPGIGSMTTARRPTAWNGYRDNATAAPQLGQDTVHVLAEVLMLTSAEIGRLHDQHIVASPGGHRRLAHTDHSKRQPSEESKRQP